MRSIYIKTFWRKMETLGIWGLIKSISLTTAFLLKSNRHSKSCKCKHRPRSKKESHNGTKMLCLTALIQSLRCKMKTWTSCLISRHLMVGKILKVKASNLRCCQKEKDTFTVEMKTIKWRRHKWARRTWIRDSIVDTRESQACKKRNQSI